MNKLLTLALGISIMLPATAGAAYAQQGASSVNPKARQKASWYNAPREIQIIDERPVVRDFREAPQIPPPIQLPPGPGANRPGAYGPGGGALGDDDPVIPAGGMPIGGGGDRGYRTPDEINPNSVPLEKTGFNRMPSNIPAAGIRPKGPLPGGYTTGIHGKVAPPNYPTAQQANPLSGARRNSAQMAAGPKPVPVLQYNAGPGYGSGVGTSSGQGGAETAVHGKLMNRLLNKVQ